MGTFGRVRQLPEPIVHEVRPGTGAHGSGAISKEPAIMPARLRESARGSPKRDILPLKVPLNNLAILDTFQICIDTKPLLILQPNCWIHFSQVRHKTCLIVVRYLETVCVYSIMVMHPLLRSLFVEMLMTNNLAVRRACPQGELFPAALSVDLPSPAKKRRSGAFTDNMKLPVHRWFRYSAGFSAEWAEKIIRQEAGPGGAVLDPFAGSGTTLLAAQQAAAPAAAHFRKAARIP
jgi:hypothetical protein